MILKLILVVLLNVYSGHSDMSINSGMEPFCEYIQADEHLRCFKFQSLDQLDFAKCTQNLKTLTIEADRNLNLVLNSKLNLSGASFLTQPKIVIKFFKGGIDPNAKVFDALKSKTFDLEILYTNWFLVSDSFFRCNDTPIDNDYIFSDLQMYDLKLEGPEFNEGALMCPIIFTRTVIKRLVITAFEPIRYDKTSLLVKDIMTRIDELHIQFTYNLFITRLSTEDILNPLLFANLKLIELKEVYLQSIDPVSLQELKHLRTLRLLRLDFVALLKNGTEWLSALNYENKKTLDDQNLTRSDFFELVIGINADTTKFIELDDDILCLFKEFPHDNLVVPLLYESDYPIEDVVPCSCTLFWLYKNYSIYKSLYDLSSEKHVFIPVHCVEIDQILLDEQHNFCDNTNRIKECGTEQSTVLPDVSANVTAESCFTHCICTLTDQLSLLECTDAIMNEQPGDFSEFQLNNEWNFVSFVGSSIKDLKEFKNLRLKEDAKVIVNGIEFFEDDLFKTTVYKEKFAFAIVESSLKSLEQKAPFVNTNFSTLEFDRCELGFFISISGFINSRFDQLLIRNPTSKSLSPAFRRSSQIGSIHIRKFKLENGYSIYKQNALTGSFGIDPILMNYFMFENLEEIEIVNTFIDFIQSGALAPLKHLRVVRLENVNLKNVIDFYFTQFQIGQTISFMDEDVNWMANPRIREIYLGREETGFGFQNEYLCYFAGLNALENSQTTVYVYDTIDLLEGIKCTCSIYWIYHRNNLSNFLSTDNSKYVPKCIKDLETIQDLFNELGKCLVDLGDPRQYCKILKEAPQMNTTDEDTLFQLNTTLYIELTSEPIVTTTRSLPQANLSTVLQASYSEEFNRITALLIVLTVFVILLCLGTLSSLFYYFYLHKKSINKINSDL